MFEGAVGEYAGEVFGEGGEAVLRGHCRQGREIVLEEGRREGGYERQVERFETWHRQGGRSHPAMGTSAGAIQGLERVERSVERRGAKRFFAHKPFLAKKRE